MAIGKFSAAKKKIESFFAVAGDVDFVGEIIFAEDAEGEFDVVGIVFDEEDFDFVHARWVSAKQGGER